MNYVVGFYTKSSLSRYFTLLNKIDLLGVYLELIRDYINSILILPLFISLNYIFMDYRSNKIS